MISVQEWLNKLNRTYSDKSEIERISLPSPNQHLFGPNGESDIQEALQGGLIINNYPNLTSINIGYHDVSHLEIRNCPLLEEIYAVDNQLTSLVLLNLPNLSTIHCENNKISSLDISNFLKLKKLSCDPTVQPIKQLAQKIQDQEKTLTQLKTDETSNQQKKLS